MGKINCILGVIKNQVRVEGNTAYILRSNYSNHTNDEAVVIVELIRLSNKVAFFIQRIYCQGASMLGPLDLKGKVRIVTDLINDQGSCFGILGSK